MSLPLPTDRYIPKLYPRDSLLAALTDKMDEHIEAWRDDAASLAWLHQPERCPADLLDELGYWLAAGLDDNDTDRQKREKIAMAVQGHKRRGSWSEDAKAKVDAIAGGDSELWTEETEAWWVLADGTGPSTYNWSAFGFDSSEGFDGIILTGAGDEWVFAGNIRIDVDNAGLTTAQVEELKHELRDVAPAYFRVILGYESAGEFVEYANGRLE